MLAAVRSAAVLGVDAFDVTVEVDCTRGLPQWMIVGLPASSVKESRERVSAALGNAGIDLPHRRVTINLAPADVAKTGTAFDLPIAIAVLMAFEIIEPQVAENAVFLGELGLDGAVRPVRGVLSVARRLVRADPPPTLVLPGANIGEASLVHDVPLCAPASLLELVGWLRRGALPLTRPTAKTPVARPTPDFADVIGQQSAKRALEIAASGGHNVLMIGAPGAGKTMLARRLPGILPALIEQEALEVTAIHSVAGLLNGGGGVTDRPFRSPHHSVSTAGLIGGGGVPRPGEVSLAHHGVLFLDELLEFPRRTLESLRQPMEDGRVTIARAASAVCFPARFTLVAATNGCPCGHAGSAKLCVCSEADIARYRSRLSGPLADRIDLHLMLAPVPFRQLADAARPECSADIRARVERARDRQRLRYRGTPLMCNAESNGRALVGELDADARKLLNDAADSLALSARAYHRAAKVARTIADLDASERVAAAHVAEALCFRPLAPAVALGGR